MKARLRPSEVAIAIIYQEGIYAHANCYLQSLPKLRMLGDGAEQAGSTDHSAGSDFYADDRATQYRSSPAKHHDTADDSGWPANPDHHSGSWPTDHASNDSDYAGHHAAKWDDTGANDSGKAGKQPAGQPYRDHSSKRSVRVSAGNI